MSDKIVAQIEIDYHWWGSFQPEEDQPAKVVSADGRGFTSDSDLNMKDELDQQVRQEIEDLITTDVCRQIPKILPTEVLGISWVILTEIWEPLT